MTVYAVLAHTDPLQLKNLLAHLPQDRVAIHLDASATASDFDFLSAFQLTKRRVDVRWGGFTAVTATLELYRTALELCAPQEKIVLLSGQCFPIRPLDEFESYLTDHVGYEYANHAPIFDGDAAHERRVREQWLFDLFPASTGRLNRFRAAGRWAARKILPNKTPQSFAPMTPVFGSQWTGLSRECVSFLLELADSDDDLQRMFRTTLAPDEIFFQTLVSASPFASRLAAGSKIVSAPNTAAVSNFHYIDPSLRGFRTIDDLQNLTESRQFFTRKLHSTESLKLISKLEKLL